MTNTCEQEIKSFTFEQKHFNKLILYKGSEHCPSCNLQYKRYDKYNHELTNTHLEANNQYYCHQVKRILNLADETFHSQSGEHKNSKECGIVRHVKRI